MGARSGSSIAAVILAAGTSSRLGRPKQLLPLGGRPVLQHVLDATAAAPVQDVVVVLGHQAKAIAGAVRLPEGGRIVINDRYAEGQSTSVRWGLGSLGGDVEAAVILLGDQPEVASDSISAVVQAWRAGGGGGPVVQASYGGRSAHPILFARKVWPDLEGLTGDTGARDLLRAHPEWLRLVEVGGSPPSDIDTEEDYGRLLRTFPG